MTRWFRSMPMLLIALALPGGFASCTRPGDGAAAGAASGSSGAARTPPEAASQSPANGLAGANAAPMDSISSASAVAMSESASNVAAQVQDAKPMPAVAASAAAPLSRDDEKFIKDVTEADLYGMQASGLARDHAENVDLKAFAAKIVVDQAAASSELAMIASAHGLKLPDATALTKKVQFGLLQHLQARNFDQRYIQDVGIDDHRNAIAMLEREATRTRDADLKTWIARTLPTLREHYAMAQQIAKTVKG